MAVKNPKIPKFPKHAQRPSINSLLSLPDDVKVIRVDSHVNSKEFFIEFESQKNRVCPHCGSNNCVIKDSGRDMTIRHIANAQMGTLLTFHKNRLSCKDCGVSFYEALDWLHPSLHMTIALYYKLCLDLTQMQSIAAIARNNYVTDSIVSSVLDTIICGIPRRLPETLCIDEFKGNSGVWDSEKSRWNVNKYHCNISDGDAGIVIDILPQIRSDFVCEYFRQYTPDQLKRVKYFCCDMQGGFIAVAKKIFPQSRICIDMFHVVKRLNDTVDTIRRRIQRDLEDRQDTVKYRILKTASRSLLTSAVKQENQGDPNNAKRQEKLKNVFNLFPELEQAHGALQEFHNINAQQRLTLQRGDLTDWICKYRVSEVPEIRDAANSIRFWRGYIHNTWEYHRSNSTCEGLNNKIKVLKRLSFGLHNFETFRKRVLLTCGYILPDNKPFTIFAEKREGKGIKL